MTDYDSTPSTRHEQPLLPTSETYLSAAQVANRYSGVSVRTVEGWRSAGAKRVGPPFIKVGLKAFYPLSLLVRWEQDNHPAAERTAPATEAPSAAVMAKRLAALNRALEWAECRGDADTPAGMARIAEIGRECEQLEAAILIAQPVTAEDQLAIMVQSTHRTAIEVDHLPEKEREAVMRPLHEAVGALAQQIGARLRDVAGDWYLQESFLPAGAV